jgi:hypothetical protein
MEGHMKRIAFLLSLLLLSCSCLAMSIGFSTALYNHTRNPVTIYVNTSATNGNTGYCWGSRSQFGLAPMLRKDINYQLPRVVMGTFTCRNIIHFIKARTGKLMCRLTIQQKLHVFMYFHFMSSSQVLSKNCTRNYQMNTRSQGRFVGATINKR